MALTESDIAQVLEAVKADRRVSNPLRRSAR